jgi:hypothetical protein
MKHAAISPQVFRRSHFDAATFLRIAVGGIWLAGATWNAFVTWNMTDPYGWLADDARVAPWRWFFSEVVQSQPEFWTALLVAGEIALGLLTLGRGHWAKAGLIGGALFSIMLVSFGTPYTLMMAPYVVLLIWLYRHEARYSVLDLLRISH